MKRRGAMAATLVLGLLVVTLPGAAQQAASGKLATELARAKADAAHKTFDVVWKNNKEGLVPFGELTYRWSRRWLEAELELSAKNMDKARAYQAHLARMQALEQSVRDRYRNRVITIEEVSGAEFFTLEARLWLEQNSPGKK